MAVKIGIDHPGIDFARGHAWLHLKDYVTAERSFRRAIDLGAKGQFVHTGDMGAYTYKSWYGLALSATGQDKYAESVEHCKAALVQKADFPDARYLLANCLRRLKRLPEARRELETLLAQAPGHTLAQADLGCLLHEQ